MLIKVQGAEPAFWGSKKVCGVTVDRPAIISRYTFNYLHVDVIRMDLGILNAWDDAREGDGRDVLPPVLIALPTDVSFAVWLMELEFIDFYALVQPSGLIHYDLLGGVHDCQSGQLLCVPSI